MEREGEPLASLTAAEERVLALVAQHYATAEIAAILGVSEATVRSHIDHILSKLGVESRREAARLWLAKAEGSADPE